MEYRWFALFKSRPERDIVVPVIKVIVLQTPKHAAWIALQVLKKNALFLPMVKIK